VSNDPDKLALLGGPRAVDYQIKPYNSIDLSDLAFVEHFLDGVVLGRVPLSGYLAGKLHGGQAVQRLEEQWATTFGVRHAIACNSATSGLLAACVVVQSNDGNVIVPAMSMSATAAVPSFLSIGGEVEFCDVDDHYCAHPDGLADPSIKDGIAAVLVTNLFGHPANIDAWRNYTHVPIVEDNAQAPFAIDRKRYTGTMGDIGVFSLNVHKHFQTGEGGMIVTNNDGFAMEMRQFINHGESEGGRIGLNLRMTELTAILGLSQLQKGRKLVASRQHLAHQLTEAIQWGERLYPPKIRPDCESSYYCYPIMATDPLTRDRAYVALKAEGVPISGGYGVLYDLPAFQGDYPTCHMAELLNERMLLIELCAIDPTEQQIKQIAEAFRKVNEGIKNNAIP
jgi:perosamine synthetase